MVKWLITMGGRSGNWPIQIVPIPASAFTSITTTTTATSLLGFFTPTKNHCDRSEKECLWGAN